MASLQRFFGGRRSGEQPKAGDHDARPDPSSAQGYAAIQRERELHRLLLAEMERRGPRAPAGDVYDELAARWDAEHAPTTPAADAAAATTMPPADPGPGADADAPPAWATQLLDEQRRTNELLRQLVDRLEHRAIE